MEELKYTADKTLEPYINCMMTQVCEDPEGEYSLPLYADGYPGIMYQQSENGFYLNPKGKRLSELFLYGQTLEPVSLTTKGRFRFVVFQLYPFASRYLLGVDPKVLNDDCFDLLQLKHVDVNAYHSSLDMAEDLDLQIEIISKLMHDLIESNKVPADDRIQNAISLILENKGQITVSEIREQVYVTERTFERNFVSQVGLTPKQFAKIIQFQDTLGRLETASEKLVDIGYDSGFADQSHFIRTFKRYTGLTPAAYQKRILA